MKPNRRGQRSRELVLDAAEQLMAERGYEGATLSAIVERAGIPMSSVYHYFGSKDAILLAVMERGSERFFGALPAIPPAIDDPRERIATLVGNVAGTLAQHPDFLQLLVVLATQPPPSDAGQAHAVVNRVRNRALRLIRAQVAVAFGVDAGSAAADRSARFALALFDGAFVATQADSSVELAAIVESLPDALIAIAER